MTAVLILLLFPMSRGAAQQTAGAESPAAAGAAPLLRTAPQDPAADSTGGTGTRRALILSGHPGTDEFRKTYLQSVEKIRDALLSKWGYSAEHVWVRCGTESDPDDDPEPARSRGPATRDAIAADVAQLQQDLAPNDSLWVVVIGHSHFDGQHVFWNLPGPDMSQADFGALFQQLKCREQVFFIAVPASGFFIRDLSAKDRVVMTATAADAETNESQFQWHLARVLHDPPAAAALDRDQDGRITLLDLYLLIVRRVMMEYRDCKLIPTEHALLDDNGDGRGTELQLDDLEPELGGRALRRPLREVIRPPGDGVLAASISMDRREQGAESDQPRPEVSDPDDVKTNLEVADSLTTNGTNQHE